MFTKLQFELFRNELLEATKSLCQKYEVDITAGKIKYDNTKFNIDLLVTKQEVNGKSFEQAEFEKLAVYYGFLESDYNKEFTNNGKRFAICGFKQSARTMPIIARCLDDGKMYKFGTQVKRLIN